MTAMNIMDKEDDRVVVVALSERYQRLHALVESLRYNAASIIPHDQAMKKIKNSEAEMERINAMLTRWQSPE